MLSSASNRGGSSIGHWKLIIIGTPVVPGGAPDFDRSVNPILTRGADFSHHITTGTPGFGIYLL